MQITPANNIVCPLDGTVLKLSNKQLVCSNGHGFDIARQSYVNLLPVQFKNSKDPGDSKAMVTARRDFLTRGYFEKIAQKLSEISLTYLSDRQNICLLDAGCGEGYFLSHVAHHLENLDCAGRASFIGLDISKWAILAACKRPNQITWMVATNNKMPILPKSLDLIVCHFGFPNYVEFSKLLKPDGKIILAEAGPDHLIELRNIIYPQLKPAKSKPTMACSEIELLNTCALKYRISNIPQQDINNLLMMTPHMYRASIGGKMAAAKQHRLNLTIDVSIRVLNLHDSNR